MGVCELLVFADGAQKLTEEWKGREGEGLSIPLLSHQPHLHAHVHPCFTPQSSPNPFLC